MWLQKRPLDLDGEVADAQVEQLFVAETMPGESVAHGEADSRVFSRKGAKGQRKGRKEGLASAPSVLPLRLCVKFSVDPFRFRLSRSIMSAQFGSVSQSHTTT